MENKIEIKYNSAARNTGKDFSNTDFLSEEFTKTAKKFFKSFPRYRATPLNSLKNLSSYLGVDKIYVKDESKRFNLNAFKVLGGAYAISKCLCEKLKIDIKDASFELLKSKETKEKLGDLTFITATDGNHGRGVAWAAHEFGYKSIVFMPKGSAEIRLQNIRKEGAEASITDMNYDDAVRHAKKVADKIGGIMVQDTAWDGYENIPGWIMQGYSIIANETIEQLKDMVEEKPTHIILQAGVGSFAGSILGYFTNRYKEDRPICAIVEPKTAACIFKSASFDDGNIHPVTGDMETIMAGLACGEPNTISWKILRDYADAYISCPDYVSAKGMRILGNPLSGDERIISGESGAVGMGILSIILKNTKYKVLKEKLKLDKKSRVLVISTEGDTYPEGYRKIVWDGKCPSYE